MQSLQMLLDKCEVGTKVNFNHLDNRVRCYAHIINICCLHIIASVTSIPKLYLSDLKVPISSDYASRDDGLDSNNSDDVVSGTRTPQSQLQTHNFSTT